MRLTLLAAAVLLPGLAGALHAQDAGAPVLVAVGNVRDARGTVHVDICRKAQFLGDGCPWSGTAPAHPGVTVVRVENVPPGDYAAQAFQDANNNGKVDRGIFGIPKEGIGFSRDAPIHFHPPHWDDAVFSHGREAQRIAFALRYW